MNPSIQKRSLSDGERESFPWPIETNYRINTIALQKAEKRAGAVGDLQTQPTKLTNCTRRECILRRNDFLSKINGCARNDQICVCPRSVAW